MSRSKSLRPGFTLIELLVSMAILMIIVLIVAQLFQQSQQAWESGSRQAEINITGRALADFMAQEISLAADDGEEYLKPLVIGNPGPNSGATIEFSVVDPAGSNRCAQFVSYSFAGGLISRVSQGYGGYGSSLLPSANGDLCRGVRSCVFSAPAAGARGLPAYVDVEVHVLSDDDFARGFTAREQIFRTRAWLRNAGRYGL
jgi:prepilin-type N-terminal cleavage/methylation domain-containing protein